MLKLFGPYVLILLVSLLANVACKSRSAGTHNELKRAGFQSPPAQVYDFSVGIIAATPPDKINDPEFLSKVESGEDGYTKATGFIIAKDDDEYIGLTNYHVYVELCQEDCWMYFQDKSSPDRPFLSLKIKRYGPGWFWDDTTMDHKFDMAFFRVEVEGDSRLKPLPISFAPIKANLLAENVGIPKDTLEKTSKKYSLSPVVSSGTTVLVHSRYGRGDVAELVVSTVYSRKGSSGSAVFLRHGEKRYLVGINFAGANKDKKDSKTVVDDPYSLEFKDELNIFPLYSGFVSLRSIKNKFPELEVWKLIEPNEDLTFDSPASLLPMVVSSKFNVSDKNKITLKIVFNQKIDAQHLYYKGRLVDNLNNSVARQNVIIEQDGTSFTFMEHRIGAGKTEPESLREYWVRGIYFEYLPPGHPPQVLYCYPAKPLRTYRYKSDDQALSCGDAFDRDTQYEIQKLFRYHL